MLAYDGGAAFAITHDGRMTASTRRPARRPAQMPGQYSFTSAPTADGTVRRRASEAPCNAADEARVRDGPPGRT
jgi:hypothetical protein